MLVSSYPILTPINPFVEQMTTIDEYTQQTFKDITESLKMLLTFVDNQDIQTMRVNFKRSRVQTPAPYTNTLRVQTLAPYTG
jgi:hypothetical protein